MSDWKLWEKPGKIFEGEAIHTAFFGSASKKLKASFRSATYGDPILDEHSLRAVETPRIVYPSEWDQKKYGEYKKPLVTHDLGLIELVEPRKLVLPEGLLLQFEPDTGQLLEPPVPYMEWLLAKTEAQLNGWVWLGWDPGMDDGTVVSMTGRDLDAFPVMHHIRTNTARALKNSWGNGWGPGVHVDLDYAALEERFAASFPQEYLGEFLPPPITKDVVEAGIRTLKEGPNHGPERSAQERPRSTEEDS